LLQSHCFGHSRASSLLLFSLLTPSTGYSGGGFLDSAHWPAPLAEFWLDLPCFAPCCAGRGIAIAERQWQREEGGRLFTCVLVACWSCLPPFPFRPHHGRARALTRVPLVACPYFASRATFRVPSAASVASAVLPLSHSVVRCHRFALGRVRVLLDGWRLSEVALERHNPALPLPPPAVVLCISWVCIVSYTLHIPSFVITAYARESYRD